MDGWDGWLDGIGWMDGMDGWMGWLDGMDGWLGWMDGPWEATGSKLVFT